MESTVDAIHKVLEILEELKNFAVSTIVPLKKQSLSRADRES